ncbi:MAG: RNA polymerase sigma factor [Caldiserica bacterium]|nr:RNA polymerase sigma factor [Caldisericota bacterium]
MSIDLKEIIKRFKNGDDAAFEELYKGTVRYIYSIVYAYLLSKEDAEDVVQNTYLKIYALRKRIDDEKFLMAYMKRIAINYAFKMMRKRQTLKIAEPVSNDPEVKETAEEVLKNLEPQERLIMTLFYMDNASIKEICLLTGEKEGTIKSKLSRARDKLREVIANERV